MSARRGFQVFQNAKQFVQGSCPLTPVFLLAKSIHQAVGFHGLLGYGKLKAKDKEQGNKYGPEFHQSWVTSLKIGIIPLLGNRKVVKVLSRC